ncbi:hypothetical protein Dsin_012597 [Dipteronia sinensis]|uniref:Reverse transcriptase zinc-binding domain-containing protein n=1 Tax=Dipteronia sinensis TaxID=43782 RepID=A0AAE0AIC5_9ROSI|nr:hypothetical protein Dsin_012597 [Dipteronia sinensis]
MAWTPNPRGEFSVSSFRKSLKEEGARRLAASNLIRKGVSPIKVEMFVWQAIYDRIMMKDVMYRFGSGNLASKECHLCGNGEEIVDHLLLHCAWTKSLWIAGWFKHIGKGSGEDITSMILNLSERCVDPKPMKKLKAEVWQPLAPGSLKFNVDGSAQGSLGHARMGGVLRNHCGIASFKHVNWIYDVRTISKIHGILKIVHNSRTTNSAAGMLAKKGSNNEGDFQLLGG